MPEFWYLASKALVSAAQLSGAYVWERATLKFLLTSAERERKLALNFALKIESYLPIFRNENPSKSQET